MDVNKESYDFWTILEADFSTKFPNYIKNLLTLSGFGTAVSFVSLNNDDDIETVYDFVRNKLPKRLDESDVNKEDFYGKFYSSAPADFEFQPGDLNWYRMTENTEEITNVLKTNQNYRKVLNHFQMYTERET